MMTADDIVGLMPSPARPDHEIEHLEVCTLRELLAMAAAFERIAVVALWNFGAPEIGLTAYRVVRDFETAAAKGFKP